MEFSRQEYWSGLPFPSPGHLPDPGIEPGCPALQQILYHLSHEGSRRSRRLQSARPALPHGLQTHSPAGILLGFRTPAGNSQWLTKSQSRARFWRGSWPGWGVSSAWGPRDRSLWRVDVPPGRPPLPGHLLLALHRLPFRRGASVSRTGSGGAEGAGTFTLSRTSCSQPLILSSEVLTGTCATREGIPHTVPLEEPHGPSLTSHRRGKKATSPCGPWAEPRPSLQRWEGASPFSQGATSLGERTSPLSASGACQFSPLAADRLRGAWSLWP